MPPSQPEGYLALPRAGEGPGVLVLHPWQGQSDARLRNSGRRWPNVRLI